jgi:hypothetical protein
MATSSIKNPLARSAKPFRGAKAQLDALKRPLKASPANTAPAPSKRPLKAGLASTASAPSKTPAQEKALARVLGNPEVARAMFELVSTGQLTGTRSTRVSARVDPGILGAAAKRLGLKSTDVSAVVNASLAVAAAPDPFKAWLANPGEPLPDDFELAI